MSGAAARTGRTRRPRLARLLLRTWRLCGFALYFTWELAVASAQVSWDVVTPRSRLHPGVVALPSASRTPAELAVVSDLFCLMPGTMVLEVGRDPLILYVHGMYAPDADRFRAEMVDLESRFLAAWRTEDEA